MSGDLAYAWAIATIDRFWSVEIISLHIEKIWRERGMFTVARLENEDNGETIGAIVLAYARYCALAWLDGAGLGMLVENNFPTWKKYTPKITLQ